MYTYVRHPRAHELKQSKPVSTTQIRGLHHDSVWVRLNARVGLHITLLVGTMWTAYLFTVIALFALPSAMQQGMYFVIVWLSSSFLQLVLLPIIIVGQNIQAKAADKRAEETYKDAEGILHECLELQKHLKSQDADAARLLELVERLT